MQSHDFLILRSFHGKFLSVKITIVLKWWSMKASSENCRFNLLLIYLHLHFHFYFYLLSPYVTHDDESDMKMLSEPKTYLRGDISREMLECLCFEATNNDCELTPLCNAANSFSFSNVITIPKSIELFFFFTATRWNSILVEWVCRKTRGR